MTPKDGTAPKHRETRGTLLCVANYPTNTGYAWAFIEGLYAQIANHLATHGIRTLVAYPAISAPPRSLAGSAAQPVTCDCSLTTRRSVRATRDLVRREDVRVVYLTDHPARRWAYFGIREVGARRILVHDHTSGERTRPHGLRRAAKWLLSRMPGTVADVIVTVSDYVAHRQVDVGMIPARRVVRVWNGLPLPAADQIEDRRSRAGSGLFADRSLIVCACRATPEKGVAHLLRAFNQAVRDVPPGVARPALIYVGDGPQLAELGALRQSLPARGDIVLAGYRSDAAVLVAQADLCVVPSVWQEAFSLAVLEAMACGKAVIATRVGGIPELIEHDVTGLLVPPADQAALATAMLTLLADNARAARLGNAARQRVAERFTPATQLRQLNALIEKGFGAPCEQCLDDV